MPIDLREWTEQAAHKEATRLNQMRESQQWVEQAAVRAEALTGRPEWDYFLTLLQPLLNRSTQVMNLAKDSFPNARTDEQTRVLLIQYWYQKGRVDALIEASSLPKMLADRAAGVVTHSPVATSQPEPAVAASPERGKE